MQNVYPFLAIQNFSFPLGEGLELRERGLFEHSLLIKLLNHNVTLPTYVDHCV